MESNVAQPVLVICGPTASGKSSLAMEVARAYNGEIICADSRTIYKGMDIGTAKPSLQDRSEIPHHLLDIVEPSASFTAHDFKRRALRCIENIQARGKLPIVAGGTGLYIDGLLFDYEFAPAVAPEERVFLEAMSLEALYKYCEDNNIELPENHKNKRYVVRNIERHTAPQRRKTAPPSNYIIVGITTEKDILRQRIAQRIEHILEHGVATEAIILGKKYGWEVPAMSGNIYPLIHRYLRKELSFDEFREKAITIDWRLAKRQVTWLKRNQYIVWKELDDAYAYVATELDKWKQK